MTACMILPDTGRWRAAGGTAGAVCRAQHLSIAPSTSLRLVLVPVPGRI
ncbi:hypothetical protein FHS31_000067 [Sphingomonas vulcanisoli]|uniref:Uncharacterized protein n=1 Tax=Sphingomonas vulcanisoli TaxID=1658060 RepID=A0ABX0TPD8_9SPHN|nr:hypothetical protein [Sphingomonas vulcanisoli]